MSLGNDGGQAEAPVLIKFRHPVGHNRAGRERQAWEGGEPKAMGEERGHHALFPGSPIIMWPELDAAELHGGSNL